MATPNQMPKKTSAVHQQILSGLVATKPSTWVKKSIVLKDGEEQVVKKKVQHLETVNLLARNVSEENVDRAAKRWLR